MSINVYRNKENYKGSFDDNYEKIRADLNEDLDYQRDIRQSRLYYYSGIMLNKFDTDKCINDDHKKGIYENILFDDNELYKVWIHCTDHWYSDTYRISYVEKADELRNYIKQTDRMLTILNEIENKPKLIGYQDITENKKLQHAIKDISSFLKTEINETKAN